jgi:hypothetical protein
VIMILDCIVVRQIVSNVYRLLQLFVLVIAANPRKDVAVMNPVMIPTLKFVVVVVVVSPAQRGKMGMRRKFVVVSLPAVLLVRLAVI